ncbi:MAG: nucleoid occlusion protein [Syntrophomonadaceae bacterium]
MLNRLEKIFGKNGNEVITKIPIDLIEPNPFQPRKDFSEQEIIELAQSIKAYGLIQPIVVRKAKDRYQIIAGERRFRACRWLGLREVAAIVQDINDANAAAISLVENLQRRELNYFEEATAYMVLIEYFGMTQDELAKKIGRSQSAIANKLRLLRLPEEVRNMIAPQVISERHARALLKLNSTDMQAEVVRQIYERDLNVKETEELVQSLSQNNMPRMVKDREEGHQHVSLIIRDARIFLNTIKETVRRARQTGINISIIEKENDDEYEILIKIGKERRANSRQAK